MERAGSVGSDKRGPTRSAGVSASGRVIVLDFREPRTIQNSTATVVRCVAALGAHGNAARLLWVSGALAAVPLDGAAALGLLVLALVRKRAVGAARAVTGSLRNHHRAAAVGRASSHALRRGRAAGRCQYRRIRRPHGASAAHTWASRRTRHAREPVSCRGSNPGAAERPIRRDATPACIDGAGST